VTDSHGHAAYAFTVPAGVNSFSSSEATIYVTVGTAVSRAHFSVKRAALEVFAVHDVVKPGGTQNILLLGPRNATVDLQVLWTDGTFTRHSLRLDSHGLGTYSLKVPTPKGHPGSRTVTIQAVTTLSSGPVIAVTHFHDR
jgi:hypothetical protein